MVPASPSRRNESSAMYVMSGPPTAVPPTLPLKISTSISETYPAAHTSRRALVLMQRNFGVHRQAAIVV